MCSTAMGRKKLGQRVRGPYHVHSGWRIDYYDGVSRTPAATLFATETQAQRAKESLEREIAQNTGTTVAEAITAYLAHSTEKGLKPKTIASYREALHRFFGIEMEGEEVTDNGGLVGGLNVKQCQALYDAISHLAVDTHRGALNASRTFLKWCVGRRWLKDNPLNTVAGKGRRRKGKAQLRIDETRKWDAVGIELAAANEGALAALLAFYLGLRASEVVQRQVRDVDDGCSVFWIPETKSAAGRRRMKIPAHLRPFLQKLVEGRLPTDWLFRGRKGKHRNRRWIADWTGIICEKAGVPKVCAHALRGMHGSFAEMEGETPEAVARGLGHADTGITHSGAYVTAEAQAEGKQRRMLRIVKREG